MTVTNDTPRRILSGIALATALLLAAIVPGNAQAQGGLTTAQLRNTTYTLEGFGSVTLIDGQYSAASGTIAGATDVVGLLAAESGDLDGDGATDAAAVLWHNGGGTGTFLYLVAMLNRGGEPQQAALAYLGDRVWVYAVAVQDGRIMVDAVVHTETDPLCCPSLGMRQVFRLQGEALLLDSGRRLGRMVSTPDGVSFVLPDGLAGGVTSARVADGDVPAHIRVDFAAGGADLPPLRVFSTAQFAEYALADGGSYAAGQTALRSLLTSRPTLAGETLLPFLPEAAGSPAAHAHEAYIEFAGGAGIRYVAAYALAEGAPEAVLYTFQGLTDDDRYYVSAAFPVAGGAPDAIDALAEDAFSPALDALDTVFETLFVSPVAIP